MYFLTVRGETRTPSLTRSSCAILSSPQLTFAVAISAIRTWRFFGTGGRPLGRDFHRQNKRKPFRCQRMRVSGLTTTSASLQSNSLLRVPIVNRVTLSVRRDLCSRSTKNVSCFRRKRFSAAIALRDRNRLRANVNTSTTADCDAPVGPAPSG